MKKDNIFTRLDNFLESSTFYVITLVILLFVLAELVSNGLNYLDNH